MIIRAVCATDVCCVKEIKVYALDIGPGEGTVKLE